MPNLTINDSADFVWPEGGNSRVPYRVFLDQHIYEREQERIFRGPTWNYVALEAEIPNPGDYKTTFVGDTPVVVNRDSKGNINCFVNRCSHKGATICIDACGNKKAFTCVYHSWSFNAQGDLLGIPFKNGVDGKGGMPADFDMKDFGLKKLRVDTLNGLVFATFDHSMVPVREYIGEKMLVFTTRVFNGRKIRILGHHRHVIKCNWKLYYENVKDPYHASLLHVFLTTFGTNRLTQKGGIAMDDKGMHHVSYSYGIAKKEDDEYEKNGLRSLQSNFSLEDSSILDSSDEFGDGITSAIHSIFPNLVVPHYRNSVAVRQILPIAPDEFELLWTFFAYEDDDEEKVKMRLKQANLVGPAGYVSMEDTEVGELIQKAIIRDKEEASVIRMGGDDVNSEENRVTETSIRGFWKNYRELMGY